MTIVWPTDLPPWLAGTIFGFFGLCVGSFLNVVIVRLPRHRSLWKPSSRCGFCKGSIPFWRNIPIVSFIVSGGACGRCGHRYSARYAMVELLTGLVFFALAVVYGWSMQAVFYSIFAAALLAMTFIDLEFRIIPDPISLGGWAIALVLSALQLPWYPVSFVDAMIGSVVGYIIFWLVSRSFYFITHEEGLGGGDIKLMGWIGACLGWKGALVTIVVGNALGLVVGLIAMGFFNKSRRSPIPFGPFLAMGAFVHLFHLDLWWWP